MTTNTSSVLANVMSRIRSAFLWLMITLASPLKSKPQYVGPKVVAIDRYSRPTMKPTSVQSVLQQANMTHEQMIQRDVRIMSARLNRMEPELSGATAAPDTGWVPSPSQPWPWLPKPEPGQKTNGLQACSQEEISRLNTTLATVCPASYEIIPGLITTL